MYPPLNLIFIALISEKKSLSLSRLCVFVCVFVYMCVCVCVCVCIYIYIYSLLEAEHLPLRLLKKFKK